MADPISAGIMTAMTTVMGAVGQLSAGNAASAAAKAEARQREQIAGQERAQAQREANEERRQADLAQSRGLAVAAAGGGAADGSTRNVLAQIEGEGEFNALTAMFSGEERAQNQEFAAEMARFKGKQAKKQSRLAAVGTVLSGASSFAGKFPGDGPKTDGVTSYHQNNYLPKSYAGQYR